MNKISNEDLQQEIESLKYQLEEYKELIDAIKNGSVDALAIYRDGHPDIFTLESTDFIYRVLVENFGESALNITETGMIIYANTAFEQLIESSNYSIIGSPIQSVIAPESIEEFNLLFQEAFSGNSKGEIILSYGGKKIPVYVSLSSLYPKFKGIAIIMTDLSEKKQQQIFTRQLEQKISERTAFIQLVLDSSVELITTCNVNLQITSINKAALQYLNLSTAEVIGKHILDIHPSWRHNAHHENIKRALKGETIASKDLSGAVKEGDIFETYFKPLIFNNEIAGVLVMERNITQLVSAKKQLEEMNHQLEHKNIQLSLTNNELASFSFIASHDLQEPLRKIQTFTGQLLDEQHHEFSEKTVNYFNRITKSANRMQSLIEDFHSYSKTTASKQTVEETDLNMVLDEVKRNFQDLITSNNAIIQSSLLPTLNLITLQWHQLFSHLISNALKFRKQNVAPLIKIEAELMDENTQSNFTVAKQKHWQISFTDNGIGFEEVYKDKIFELFQRLHNKDEYTGTGTGLAICKKIIQNHNGSITVHSKVGEGTTFRIYLPDTK